MARAALFISLGVLWLLCLAWQIQENRTLARLLAQAPVPQPLGRRLLGQARWRSFQFLLTLGGCAFIAGLYDWKLNRPAPPVAAEQAPLGVASSYPPPGLQGELVRLDNAPLAPPGGVALPSSATLQREAQVYALFAPSAGGNQGDLDSLKRRYEELFVQYLFLAHCGLAATEDYQILSTALLKELASLNGPGRLSYDILTAARGTYDEVYAKSVCDTTEAKAGQDRFRRYVDYLRTQQDPLKP